MLSKETAIAANRFGLGARPGDAAAIGSDARGWLAQQLDVARAAPAAEPASARVLAEVGALRAVRQVAAQVRANPTRRPNAEPSPASPGIDEQAIRELGTFIREHYVAQTTERHRLALESDRPFVERLVHFWSNHFAVSADKQPLAALAGLYEQEAIRPHVTGNFYDLLLAAERHPAMILYLDNQASMGSKSGEASNVREENGNHFLFTNEAVFVPGLLLIHQLNVFIIQYQATHFHVTLNLRLAGETNEGGEMKPVS
jgi:uncharacterized protein (DUF1800 family)